MKMGIFRKIAAVPADAVLDITNSGSEGEGIWYTLDGTEIGSFIWGASAIIQHVENDPCAKIHGIQYVSPIGPGFGKFKP